VVRSEQTTKSTAPVMTLYQYEHCPYCRRCVILLKLKGLGPDKVQVRAVPYDDEKTVMDLHPRHEQQLPLLDTGSTVVAESMDILAFLDQAFPPKLLVGGPLAGLQDWLETLHGPSMYLLLPGWYGKADRYLDLRAPSSREYFRKYKEALIKEVAESEGADLGTFEKCVASAPALREEVEQVLAKMPVWEGSDIGVDDVALWAELDALSVVDGLTFPEQVRRYMSRFPSV